MGEGGIQRGEWGKGGGGKEEGARDGGGEEGERGAGGKLPWDLNAHFSSILVLCLVEQADLTIQWSVGSPTPPFLVT